MVCTIIKHRVKDFKTWKKAYDGFRKTRKEYGEVWSRVYQDTDNPNMVTVYNEWSNSDKLDAFLKSNDLKTAMKKAGVLLHPDISVLEHADSKSGSRVAHFEIPATDIKRAEKFYNKVFGWSISKWDGPTDYWLIDTAEGIGGGLLKKQSPINSIANTIEVSSVDNACMMIKKNGGECITPKQAIPGVGYMAYFKDTEGNIGGLMQSDMNAN